MLFMHVERDNCVDKLTKGPANGILNKGKTSAIKQIHYVGWFALKHQIFFYV